MIVVNSSYKITLILQIGTSMNGFNILINLLNPIQLPYVNTIISFMNVLLIIVL